MNGFDRRGQSEQGFTLIELLVVIIIIGVLAAIAIPVFLNQRRKGVDASLKSDLRHMAMIEETWAADNPGQTATKTAADFADLKKSSTATLLRVDINPNNGGYCLIARNSGMTNYASGYLWYDSLAGGLISTAPSLNAPAGAVACGVGLPGTWTVL